MITTHEVADALGRSEMATRIGVGLTAISAAVCDGKFRPAWYKTMREMAAEKGVEIPDSLFRWKVAPDLEATATGGSQ